MQQNISMGKHATMLRGSCDLRVVGGVIHVSCSCAFYFIVVRLFIERCQAGEKNFGFQGGGKFWAPRNAH